MTRVALAIPTAVACFAGLPNETVPVSVSVLFPPHSSVGGSGSGSSSGSNGGGGGGSNGDGGAGTAAAVTCCDLATNTSSKRGIHHSPELPPSPPPETVKVIPL